MDTMARETVFGAIAAVLGKASAEINEESTLIGVGGLLDSMRLIELCVSLEDKAQEMGFEFDWTSDVAMSRSRSMFRTAGSLAHNFAEQSRQRP
ncbi:acyl carrier protein [Desulfovibrio sp. ZJ369]|uniref:acyl carrier protein n=1 Tax=Desulfovibrio sp. ZJ369 TaxID=2709793 RepID=UPI0013EBA2CE|nr:acyl carrier protein [Desulfovibrio sp. ZJ369]